MAKSRHFHRYKKDVLGRAYVIYKCTLPGCSHYIPANLLVNRLALCGECEEVIVIDKLKAQQAIPRCDKHTESRVKEEVKGIISVLDEALGDV